MMCHLVKHCWVKKPQSFSTGDRCNRDLACRIPVLSNTFSVHSYTSKHKRFVSKGLIVLNVTVWGIITFGVREIITWRHLGGLNSWRSVQGSWGVALGAELIWTFIICFHRCVLQCQLVVKHTTLKTVDWKRRTIRRSTATRITVADEP